VGRHQWAVTQPTGKSPEKETSALKYSTSDSITAKNRIFSTKFQYQNIDKSLFSTRVGIDLICRSAERGQLAATRLITKQTKQRS